MFIPYDKILVLQQRCTTHDLAQFVGHALALSMGQALRLQARTISRSAARLSTAAPHWEAVVMLSDLVQCERPRGHSTSTRWCGTKFSDASRFGYGAYVTSRLCQLVLSVL